MNYLGFKHIKNSLIDAELWEEISREEYYLILRFVQELLEEEE